MTKEQIELLELGISPIDNRVILIIGSGMEWLKTNTTFEFDMNNDEDLKSLPYRVRLFLVKFFDIQMLGTGIVSESIEGLSQSFSQTNKEDLVWDAAKELLSNDLKSRVRFVTAKKVWF